jgi:hypothetical protein
VRLATMNGAAFMKSEAIKWENYMRGILEAVTKVVM